MFNLEESIKNLSYYSSQRDFQIKIVNYSLGIIIFVEIIRKLISEIKLLQLTPGVYLIFLLFSLFTVIFCSEILVRLPFEIDNKKDIGTKINTRLQLFIFNKFLFFCFFFILFLALTIVLPLSLDSLNSYGQNNLENFWSVTQVISLEILLLFVLLLLGQIPIIGMSIFTTEQLILYFSKFLRILSFFIFIFSGLITPTIDGYTQISFSAFTLFIFFLFLGILEKRICLKLSSLIGLTS